MVYRASGIIARRRYQGRGRENRVTAVTAALNGKAVPSEPMGDASCGRYSNPRLF
jgi:hypothetical protein